MALTETGEEIFEGLLEALYDIYETQGEEKAEEVYDIVDDQLTYLEGYDWWTDLIYME